MSYSGSWWLYFQYDDQKPKPRISPKLLQRVWGYAKPRGLLLSGLFSTIVIMTGLKLLMPLLLRDIFDYAIPQKDTTYLTWLILGLMIIPLLNGAVEVVQRHVSARIGEGVICDLRMQLFCHLQQMSLRFFTHTKMGELISRINTDVVGAQSALTETFINFSTNILTIISTLIIMLSLDWQLTLLSVGIMPLFIWPIHYVGRIVRQLRREQMDLNAKLNSLINETLSVDGALLIKLFGCQDEEQRKFYQRSQDLARLGIREATIGTSFFAMLGFVMSVGLAVAYGLGGYLILQGHFTVGMVIAFGNYLAQLYGPLSAMSNAHLELATSLISFERVFEVIDLPIEIENCPNAIALTQVMGTVKFDHVSFSYSQGGDGGAEKLRLSSSQPNETDYFQPPEISPHKMAIENLSFEIQPGQLAAVVGPSGAGKTTISYLLPRLYDPTSGQIYLDGYDLRQLCLKSLARNIGLVTQQTYLFHDTLRNNLLYAHPQATSAEIEAACRAANIHDLIMTFPQGYDTIVGERGYRLSGGEKQRLSIARVILKNPRILILDEATSNLDSQSEALIQEALERVMRGRTSIVIAHRLSTILAADVILVMQNGCLVEQAQTTAQGSAHEHLLAQNGLYAQLYQTQFATTPHILR